MDEVKPIPEGLSTARVDGAVHIVRRWYTPVAWFLLVFTVLWNGFLIAWYTFALLSDSMPEDALNIPLVHVGFGVVAIYTTASMFLNRTTVELSNRKVIVRHGPVPWWGNIDMESINLTHAFCGESPGPNNRNSPRTYRVYAVTRDGRKISLVGGGLKMDQALYIAREVRTHLGLSHAPVVGQVN